MDPKPQKNDLYSAKKKIIFFPFLLLFIFASSVLLASLTTQIKARRECGLQIYCGNASALVPCKNIRGKVQLNMHERGGKRWLMFINSTNHTLGFQDTPSSKE